MTDNGSHSYTEGSEPIKLTEQERIESEALDFISDNLTESQYSRGLQKGYIAGATAERELMNKLYSTSKESFLAQTSFKNVSGNWQFNGSITPERVFQVLARQLKEERNKAIDECIESLDFSYEINSAIKIILSSLKSDSK